MKRLLALALLLASAAAVAACRTSRLGPCGEDVGQVLDSVRIVGNREVSRKDLIEAARDEFSAMALGKHPRADAHDAAWAMEQHLKEEGYARAKVDFEMDGGLVTFRVVEGPRVVLGCVEFEGLHSVARCEACELYDFEGSGFLGLPPVLYREEEVEDAGRELEWLYALRGWYRAKVGQHRVRWRERDGMLVADVTVPVEEGRRYFVSGVVLEGTDLTRCELDGIVGQPFTPRTPTEVAARVRRSLGDMGYPYAEARGEADVDDALGLARIRVRARPGAAKQIVAVHVEGTDRTRPAFVRGQVRIAPYTPYHGGRLREDVSALYSSGLFSVVRPRVVHRGPGTADVVISVEELKARSIEVFAGYGSYDLLRGGLRYTDDNLFGWARRLVVEANASFKGYGGEVRIEDPWTFGRDTLASLVVRYERREEPFYLRRSAGFEAALERRFSRCYRLRGGYELAVDRVSDIRSDIPADALGALVARTRTSALFLEGTRDTRDDPFLPTCGMLAVLGVKWSDAILGADLEYFELGARVAFHRSLGEVAVLTVGADLDTRWPLGGLETLPIHKRYFLGGASTVRSFGQDELTPVDAAGNGVGGLTALHGTVELRRQIVDALHGAVFYDWGIVSEDPLSFDGAFGNGIGAGLRYYLPVGPIRVDVAYNPGALHAADSRWQVHLTFGFTF